MLTDKLTKAFDEPGCAVNQAKTAKERKAGLLGEDAHPRRRRRRLCLRRRQDRPAADHRRGTSRPRPDRLRRQQLEQPQRRLDRPDPLPVRLHHRPFRARHHPRRREEALPGDQGDRRALPAARRLRLRHLRAGPDRRARRRGVRGSGEAALDAGHPGDGAGVRRIKELRQQARRRRPARPRHRHPRAGDLHPLRHQPLGRIQRRRRDRADPPAPRPHRHPHPRLDHRRRPLRRRLHRASGARQHGRLQPGAGLARPQVGGALRHPVLRGLVLRHRRDDGLASDPRPHAGRARGAGGPARPRRGGDRGGSG